MPFARRWRRGRFCRLISEKLRQKTGFAVIVENRPGANGSIGGNAVNLAEPDGTTLLFSAGTHVMAREVMKKAPYDPIDDFVVDCSRRRGAHVAGRVAEGRDEHRRRADRRGAQGAGKMDLWDLRAGRSGPFGELEFNRLSGLAW